MAQVAMVAMAMIHARSSGGFLDHLFGAAVPSDLCAAFHQPCQGEFGGGKEGISGGERWLPTPEKWCSEKICVMADGRFFQRIAHPFWWWGSAPCKSVVGESSNGPTSNVQRQDGNEKIRPTNTVGSEESNVFDV